MSEPMSPHDRPYDDAGDVGALEGEVVVLGPGGVGVSLTPAAADMMADELKRAAADARSQDPNDKVEF